ncbi:N-acetyltransferase [Enterococcus florum]|uniref:N-acetyltransferase n=1 Tax=Enterococcus florum TaxID=2480627 RepID=A0A4V0WPN0_9ENTE|nr:GNAT family protein [Enterococcus florum]GCF94429.1 N-acetyltransferase [Enterococcus florum]
MSEELQVTLREAIPDDAAALIEVMKQLAEETDFLIMDQPALEMTLEMMALNLAALYESPNNCLFIAFVNGKIVGLASIKASDDYRVAHIGEVGISLLKDYWGFGLGSLLMEELILWAEEGQLLRRLELTVQVRNQRAIHLYEKMGFEKEATIARGARSEDGAFLDVYLMRLFIN